MKYIKLKLVEKVDSKLELVKLIKNCSNLGLKDCKDICDHLHDGIPQSFELKMDGHTDFGKKFCAELKRCGGKILVNGGTEESRNFKMLELGLGNSGDYQNFLLNYIENNFDNHGDLLRFVLSKLSKKDLVSAFELTKENYKNYIHG
jgi:hypothetical protein